jgi:hypothetical protein
MIFFIKAIVFSSDENNAARNFSLLNKPFFMKKTNNPAGEGGRHENPLPREIKNDTKRQAANAHEQAERDIQNDPEFSAHSPNDDLDEGETARLGENTDLI